MVASTVPLRPSAFRARSPWLGPTSKPVCDTETHYVGLHRLRNGCCRQARPSKRAVDLPETSGLRRCQAAGGATRNLTDTCCAVEPHVNVLYVAGLSLDVQVVFWSRTDW